MTEGPQRRSLSEGEVDPSGGAIFLVLGLFIGVIFRRLQRKLRLPYTVILLVLGVIIGAIEFNAHMGALGDSVTSWVNLDPHRILIIFLPSLIFGSAYAVDYHVFSYEFWQMLCLAGPGVVLSTVFTSLVAIYMFDYGWNWYTGLTFGAMLSATDPVAVVALLRELGAPLSLSLLIEGESLLNDGTAMVVFLVFKDFMTGFDRTVGETIGFFCRLSFGGAALGVVMGYFTYKLLARMQFDTVAQITTTIIAAYGSFIIAEGTPAHLSGVLAVVGLGLFLASTSRTVVHEHHTMHSFWEMIEYLANTLIFLLAGLVIFERGLSRDSIRLVDWGYLFLLYLMVNIVRFAVNFILLPLLKRCGYGMSWKEFFVLSWAGLRGAVGLTLALFLEDSEGVDIVDKDRFVFHMAGVAALTLLVNGTTTGFVVRKLKLAKSSEASDLMFMKAVDHVNHHIHEATENLKHDAFYQDSDWKQVEVMMEKLRKHLRGRVKATLLQKEAGKQARKALGAAMSAAVKVVEGPNLTVLRGADFVTAPRASKGPSAPPKDSVSPSTSASTPTSNTPGDSPGFRPPRVNTNVNQASFDSDSKISASEQSSTPLVVMGQAQRNVETANADVICADDACIDPPLIVPAGEGDELEKGLEKEMKITVPRSTPSEFTSFASEEAMPTPSGAVTVPHRQALSASFDHIGFPKAEEIHAPPRSATTDFLTRPPPVPAGMTRREKARLKALIDTRRRFLNLVKAQYWEQFETGMVGPSAVRLLVESASWAQDFPYNALQEWQFLKKYTGRRWYYNFILRLCGRCRGDRLLYKPLGFEYDLATTFIDAHNRAKSLLQSLAPPKAFQCVAQEIDNMVAAARLRVDEISTTFPEVTRSIKTFHVVHALAKEARNVAKHLLHDGEIEEKEFEIIDEAAVNLSAEVGRPRVSVDDKAVLRDVSYFKTLDDNTFEKMFAVSEKKLHKPGDIILAQGIRAHGVYIVIRGSVTRYRTRPENEKDRNVADRIFSQAPESDLFNVQDDKLSLQKRLDSTRAADSRRSKLDNCLTDDTTSGEDGKIHASSQDSSDGIIRVNRDFSESSVGLPQGFVARSDIGSTAKLGAGAYHIARDNSAHKVNATAAPTRTVVASGPSGSLTTDHASHDPRQGKRHCKNCLNSMMNKLAAPVRWFLGLFKSPELDSNFNPKELPPNSYFVDHISPGGVIGVLSMLTGKRQGVTARCDSNVVTVYLDQSKMIDLLKSAPHPRAPIRVVQPLEVILCRMAAVLVAEMHLSAFAELSPSQIRQMLGKATLVRPEPFRPIKIQGKAILLTGNLMEPVNWEKLASLCGGSLASAWGMTSPKVANPQLLRIQHGPAAHNRARPKTKEHRRSRLSQVRSFDIEQSVEKPSETDSSKKHKRQQALRAANAEAEERAQHDSGYEEDTEESAVEVEPETKDITMEPLPEKPPLPLKKPMRVRRKRKPKPMDVEAVSSLSSLNPELAAEAKAKSSPVARISTAQTFSSDELIEVGDKKHLDPTSTTLPPGPPSLQHMNTAGRIKVAKNIAEGILAAPIVDDVKGPSVKEIDSESSRVKRHETPVNRLKGFFKRQKDGPTPKKSKHGFDPDYHARLRSVKTVLTVNGNDVVLSAEDFRPVSYGFFFLDSEPDTTRWFSPNTRLLVIPLHFASMFNNARQRVMESIQLHRHLRKVSTALRTVQESKKPKGKSKAHRPNGAGVGLLKSQSTTVDTAPSRGFPPAPPHFSRHYSMDVGRPHGLGIRDQVLHPHESFSGSTKPFGMPHHHDGRAMPAHPPLVSWRTVRDLKALESPVSRIRREGSFGNLHEAEDSLEKLSTTQKRKESVPKPKRRRGRRHTIVGDRGVGIDFDTSNLRNPGDIHIHTKEELTAMPGLTPKHQSQSRPLAATRSMSSRALQLLAATESTIQPTTENPHPNVKKHLTPFDSRMYANKLHHGKKLGMSLAPRVHAISAARYNQCRSRKRMKAEAEAWLHHSCVDDLQRPESDNEMSKPRRRRRRRRRMSSFDEGSRHATELALHEFSNLEVSGFCSDTDGYAEMAASKLAMARKAKKEAEGKPPRVNGHHHHHHGPDRHRHVPGRMKHLGPSSIDLEEKRPQTPVSDGFDSVDSMEKFPRAPPISLSRPHRSPLLSSMNRRLHGNRGLHAYTDSHDPTRHIDWHEPADIGIGMDLSSPPEYEMADLALGPSASASEVHSEQKSDDTE